MSRVLRLIRSTNVHVSALIAIMAAVATVGFRGVFSGWGFLLPVLVGVVGALAVDVLAVRFRLLRSETVAISLLGLVLVGVFVVTPVPSFSAPGDFINALINSWSDLLSLLPPVDIDPPLRIVPFVVAWVCTAFGLLLSKVDSLPGLGSMGAIAAMILTSLFSLEYGPAKIFVPAALVSMALIMIWIQQRRLELDRSVFEATRVRGDGQDNDGDPLRSKGRNGWRLVSLGILGTIAILAPLAAPFLPGSDEDDRFDLRELSSPPFNPLESPSPLVELKAELRDDRSNDVVFTVSSPAHPDRFTLAVLPAYDGTVWSVADPRGDVGATFKTVGSQVPSREFQDDGEPVDVTITVESLDGPWVPVPGLLNGIDFETNQDVRYNEMTGTVAVPAGLGEGSTYRVNVSPYVTEDDEVLRLKSVSPLLEATALDVLPPTIQNYAADLLEGEDYGWPQVESLREIFVDGGFYDDSPSARPGHSYFRIAEFLADPERLVGYEEQYAATAGVIARVADIPTRVVVGYVIADARYEADVAEVRAGDITAWIEVRVDELGWIPVDVTPDRAREPQAEQSSTTIIDVAVPNPPPPPPPPLQPDPIVDEIEEDDDEEEPEEEEEPVEEDSFFGTGARRYLLTGGIAVGTPTVLLLIFGGVVIAVKARKLRQRRNNADPALSVAGAWYEVLDRHHSQHRKLPEAATPVEAAALLAAAGAPEEAVFALAADADRAAYHPSPPDEEIAKHAWEQHDRVVKSFDQDLGLWARWKARVDPRPVLWGRTSSTFDQLVAARSEMSKSLGMSDRRINHGTDSQQGDESDALSSAVSESGGGESHE